MSVKLGVKKVNPEAVIPKYAHPSDSGFDLSSVENVVIEAHSYSLVKTGLAFNIPKDHEIQVRSRSGLGTKGLQAHFGTIDEAYRGEVGVILYNHNDKPWIVTKGERIAQAVIAPIVRADLFEVNELDETERGDNGFGSTGVK
jgi:dUTP pyrophosphatase